MLKPRAHPAERQIGPPLVIKIGGSLAESGRIGVILDMVAAVRRPLVVVPGGGPFADAVRAAQAAHGFPDRAAHRMALLAMHQMGLMMVAMQPRLVIAETLAEIRRACRSGTIPLWLPWRLSDGDPLIPTDWSITSDGLAARLGERLKAAAVLLVKSCPVDECATARILAQKGVIDFAFADIVERAGLAWAVIGPGQEGALRTLLCDAKAQAHAIEKGLASPFPSTYAQEHARGRYK